MDNKITLPELVRNKTLSAEMAGFLWSAVSQKVSFITSALYRNAGKSTLSKAVLDFRPDNVKLHYVADNPLVTEKLLKLEKPGGYLIVSEISPAGVPGYIWGEKVIHVFEMLKMGYSLQACIHAESARDAILQITEGNGVSDVNASGIKLVIYIEMFGSSMADVKRRVSEIFEVHYVENGVPMGHPLFKWNREDDSFEKAEESHLITVSEKELQKRSDFLRELSSLGKTSYPEVEEALKSFGM